MNKTRTFILIIGTCIIVYALYYTQNDIEFNIKLGNLLNLQDKNQISKKNKIESEIKPKIYLSSCKNRVEKNFEKSVFTLLTDGENYYKSAVVLIKSIKAHTDFHDYDTVVLEIKEKPLNESTKELLSMYGWKICQVDRIAPRDEAKTHRTFRDQFTKLIIWNFTEYEAIYYFDSDTFVIRNIDSFLNIHKNFDSTTKIGVTRDIRENN